MAVDVKIDTPQRTRLVAMSASLTYLNTFGTVVMKTRTSSGCAIRPTQRSVIARHQNNSFVGDEQKKFYEERSGSKHCPNIM